jgi:hypothetical protein
MRWNPLRVTSIATVSICAAALAACSGSSDDNKQGAPGVVETPPPVTNMVMNPGTAGMVAMMQHPIVQSGTGGTTPIMQPPSGTGGSSPAPMMDAGMIKPVMDPLTTTGSDLYDPMTKTLMAPADGDGVQISTDPFDLLPGEEKFTCYHAEIPVDGEIDVRYYESVMAAGSHHFILYKNDGDTMPPGTTDQTGCLANPTGSNWVYSSAQPHMDLKIPEGVAIVLGSRQRVVFDMHYINTTDQTLHAQVTLNISFAKGEFQKASSLVSYNSQIFIPPDGEQTVGGDCTPGDGAKFFYMLTHTHRRGVLATITRVLANGQMGEELVHSSDWEIPQEKKYLTDPFLTFMPGEKFHYECQYMNDLDQIVTAGPSADTNEMCMAITYYFPASAGGSCF